MRICVLGAGAWGSALAHVLAARHDTLLWARDATLVERIRATRCNERYLPGQALSPRLRLTSALDEALEHARGTLSFVAVPTGSLRALLRQLRLAGFEGTCAWLCKGVEQESGLLAHQIAAAELPDIPAGPLSGPSFAEEVALGLPTALVAAGTPQVCATITAAVHGDHLRVYSTDDVVGVEIGGAVKNVMAIGTGIADAMGLGHNARAALITRALSETRRLGCALGARAETFTGLSGMGDLILTCTGDLSRNRRVGLALGHGVALEQAVAGLGHVAEGVWSAAALVERARAVGVEMPIAESICDVLQERCSPRAALERLLSRDPRAEHH